MTTVRRPTLQAVARLWLHDLQCMSDSCSGEDHARRTQSAFARAVVAAYRAGDDLEPIIHRHTCLGCPSAAAHCTRSRRPARPHWVAHCRPCLRWSCRDRPPGYWERNLDDQLHHEAPAPAMTDPVRKLLRNLTGATLVGSNPAFDAAFLRARFGFMPWHHRLFDLSAYAAGVFHWTELRGLAAVRAELVVVHGFDIPEPDHSARGDVMTLRACHQACAQMAFW